MFYVKAHDGCVIIRKFTPKQSEYYIFKKNYRGCHVVKKNPSKVNRINKPDIPDKPPTDDDILVGKQ